MRRMVWGSLSDGTERGCIAGSKSPGRSQARYGAWEWQRLDT